MLKRLLMVILFSMAFAYIESSVVVYLRVIFHPEGFSFPMVVFDLNPLWRRLLLTEIGREAATLVLIATGAWLFGRNAKERWAYALVIFATWDIFYYVWLKLLLDWPASIMDWDILFLIPVAWASPVLYPVLVSLAMLVVAVVILMQGEAGPVMRLSWTHGVAVAVGCGIIVLSFCQGGTHMTETDYADYFSWPLFAAGFLLASGACARAYFQSRSGCSADGSKVKE